MKILVIRYKAIGDVLLSSTICSSLRESFPDSQIDYLVYAPSHLLFEHSKDIDNIIKLTSKGTKNPFKYIATAWRITRAKYDVIVDVTSTHKTELLSLFSPQAKFRIGRKKSKRGFFYTHRVSVKVKDKVEQKMALLQPLADAGHNIVYQRDMRIDLSESEKISMLDEIIAAGVDMTKPVFAFSVSSKYRYKMWNLNYMREVAEHCLNAHGAQVIVLTGMPDERATIEKFKQQLDNHPSVFNSIEAPGLRDLAVLLSHCDLYVGNEGGPRHIAEAVGIPTVSVTSPSLDANEWVRAGRTNHQSIGWQNILTNKSKVANAERVVAEFDKSTNNDAPAYKELYDEVKARDLIALVDDVVSKHVIKSS